VKVLCAVVAGLLHYLFLTSFAWMCLEGVQLYVLLVEVFEAEKSRVSWYYVAAYGTHSVERIHRIAFFTRARRYASSSVSCGPVSVCLSVCLCALSPFFSSVLFVEKCIRLVCENLTIFPYGQYIVGIYVSLAFWQYRQLQDQSGGWGEMYKNV